MLIGIGLTYRVCWDCIYQFILNIFPGEELWPRCQSPVASEGGGSHQSLAQVTGYLSSLATPLRLYWLTLTLIDLQT